MQRIDKVFDLHAAEALGLRSGQLVILVHTGSRGLGHQVCTDWVRSMDAVMAPHGIQLPDRELACAPYESPEGKKYFQPPGMGSLAGSVRDRRWWLQFLSGVP